MSIAQLQHPQSSALGSLVWFGFGGPVEYIDGKRTVLPVKVNTEDLYTWFAELGLDESILPPQVRRIDKFRAVTSAARHRYEVTNGRAELYVEEVQYDVDQVVRNVMRRVTDDKRRVTVDHVGTLKFIRGGRTAKVRRTTGDHWRSTIMSRVQEPDRAQVQSFITKIDTEYREGSESLDSTALRGIARRYLISLNGVPLRSNGGIYFVPASTAEVLPRLSEAIRRINSPGYSLDYVPFVDGEHERAVLADAVGAEILSDCGEVSRLMDARRKAATNRGKLAPNHYADVKAGIDRISDKVVSYLEEFNLPMGPALTALEELVAKHSGLMNPLTLRK